VAGRQGARFEGKPSFSRAVVGDTSAEMSERSNNRLNVENANLRPLRVNRRGGAEIGGAPGRNSQEVVLGLTGLLIGLEN
jgi:hypothetical protein